MATGPKSQDKAQVRDSTTTQRFLAFAGEELRRREMTPGPWTGPGEPPLRLEPYPRGRPEPFPRLTDPVPTLSLPTSPVDRAAAPAAPTVPSAVLEMRALFGQLAFAPAQRRVVTGVVIAAFVLVLGGMLQIVLGPGPGAPTERSMRMDWSSPVTYGVLLALVATVVIVRWNVSLWVATIAPLPDAFDRLTQEFRALSTQMRRDVDETLLRLPPRAFGAAGPARLTVYGTTLGDFVSAKEWAAGVAPSLVDALVGRQPYQIEDLSRDYVATRLEPDMQERVAVCAYEFGIERGVVKSVLSVVLRDELQLRVQQARA